MTDQRYAGPEGEKRLELLEELARLLRLWFATDGSMCDVAEVSNVLERDNERVSRLNQGQVFDEVIKDFKVPLRGLGKDKRT